MEKEITDKVLGQLKFFEKRKIWWKHTDVSLYSSDHKLDLWVQDENHEGVLDVQREAYKRYMENADKYIKEVPQYILDYYKWHYEEIDREVELEDNQKIGSITAEGVVNDLMNFYYLFICRDGSYGWLASCCWDDNYFAILLSESKPRMMTYNQLYDLNKLNDDTFGLLVHDGMQRWLGLEQNQFYGESGILQIEVEGGYDEEISPIQQKAYKTYLKNKEAHFKDLTKMMLTVYLGDEKKADAAMKVNGVTVVDRSLLPKTLYIDKEGNYGWICYSSWDDKYLGVLLSEKGLHVMRTDELLSYAIYKRKNEIVMDNVFGILFTDYMGYEKTLIVKLAGRTYTLPLTIRADDAELTDEMRSAYKQYLKLNSTLWEGVKDAMLEYYLRGYDWFSTFMDFPEELSKENVNRENVMSLVQFKKLYISNIDGRIAWLCECPTAEEEGLAFEFTDGEIEAIAQTDII